MGPRRASYGATMSAVIAKLRSIKCCCLREGQRSIVQTPAPAPTGHTCQNASKQSRSRRRVGTLVALRSGSGAEPQGRRAAGEC